MSTLDAFWRPPPRDLALKRDEVHVWCADLALAATADAMPLLTRTLSRDERLRATQFHVERDRVYFSAARGLLRGLLGGYLGAEPARLVFTYDRHGKPTLSAFPVSSDLQFNLAHAGGLAVYAFTRARRIGIDLEQRRPFPDGDQIAERFFSIRERERLAALSPDEKEIGFFNCWTRKEAYVKAIGEGLAQPLDQFDVSLAPGEPAQLLATAGSPEETERWRFQELTPADEYIGALAVEGHDWHLSCWLWIPEERRSWRTASMVSGQVVSAVIRRSTDDRR
jgi:4'-phosphopantetheinyl transferase